MKRGNISIKKEAAMPGLVIRLDTDHQKPVLIKDHAGRRPKKVAPKNPHNPVQDLVDKGIVAVQTVTIVWTKSSPRCVWYWFGGNWHCICS